MEFPISIRVVQASDLDQIYLIIEKNADSCRNISKEMIEERIRNHAGTFLLASLEEQVIGFIIGADLTETTSRGSAFDIDFIEMLSYFEMNAFIEHGFAESENSSDPYFHMHWDNPYYQEEI